MPDLSSALAVPPLTAGPSQSFATSQTGAANSRQSAAVAEKKAAAYRDFETFILQSFIEHMLPDKADGVYGGGIAGQTWKSMMADKIAGEVAKSGRLGLAEVLSKGGSPSHGPEGK